MSKEQELMMRNLQCYLTDRTIFRYCKTNKSLMNHLWSFCCDRHIIRDTIITTLWLAALDCQRNMSEEKSVKPPFRPSKWPVSQIVFSLNIKERLFLTMDGRTASFPGILRLFKIVLIGLFLLFRFKLIQILQTC